MRKIFKKLELIEPSLLWEFWTVELEFIKVKAEIELLNKIPIEVLYHYTQENGPGWMSAGKAAKIFVSADSRQISILISILDWFFVLQFKSTN